MKVKEGLFYTEDHDWVEVDGNTAVIGIADFAQDQLGDIVYVELPEEGDAFDAEDAFATVESVKAAADIYAPVGGEVVEVNEEIMDDPGLVNEDPYANWFIKVELSDASEVEGLMDADAYKAFLDEEA